MPILAIETLVVGIRLTLGKTPEFLSSSFRIPLDSKPLCLRILKQSEQYISFPAIGAKGTTAAPPQEIQTVLYMSLRDSLCGDLCRVIGFSARINTRTPSA